MKQRPNTTEPSPRSQRTLYLFCYARPTLRPRCEFSILQRAQGLPPKAALGIVGPTGHVTAADFSPAMVERARERLAQAKNASVAVEDGQALSFSDRTFDAV